ncbi:MAG TPA: sulfatase [Streptosporangiaceae bacterium]
MVTTRPNLLIVHWHDVGRRLGAYGEPGVETPNIDRLAAEGVRLDHAYATASFCSPSRAALFTGRYAHANGMLGPARLGWSLNDGEPRLPVLLRDAGYRSVLIGVQDESDDPLKLGFDEVAAMAGPSFPDRGGGQIADAALAWLEENADDDRPFLMSVGFTEARRPWPADLYPPDGTDRVRVPGELPDNAWIRDDLAVFAALVAAADRETGRVLDRLETLGLAGSTWVIFTTDHGAPFPRAKGTLYDPGIATAMIMRFPAGWPIPDGGEDRLVSQVDLVPTVIDRLGVDLPQGLHGVSHLRWLLGDTRAPRRREVFAENTFGDVYDPMRTVRTARWKYIRGYEPRPALVLPADVERSPMRYGYGDDHLRPRAMEELYDLADDPLEQVNLADDPSCSAIRADLAGRMLRWRQRSGDPLLAGRIQGRPVPRNMP